jgi:excisionase family DNA binding protein
MRPEREMLWPSEVARIWHVSLRTVQHYAADGKLPAARLPGGHYRIHPDDASAVLQGAGTSGGTALKG